jgi:hypothetical protein
MLGSSSLASTGRDGWRNDLGFRKLQTVISNYANVFQQNQRLGAPYWTRTSDPQLRRLLLYPTELRALNNSGEVHSDSVLQVTAW